MKCPYCDKEMEEGYITSDARCIAWRKERYESAWVSKKSDGIQLSRTFAGAVALDHAYCCKKCKKIIIDYLEEK